MEESFNSWDLPLFFSAFIFIYLSGYFLVFRKWTPETRSEASSCLISLVHGSSAVVLAIHAVISSSPASTDAAFFAAGNTAYQNTVLNYSCAYFFADLVHLFSAGSSGDALFIAHHIAVLFVFLTCRYIVGHGACVILTLLVLAEVTSPCQNTWALSALVKTMRGVNAPPLAAKLRRRVEFPFYATYSICRGVIAPAVLYKMTMFYAGGGADDVIPKWVWMSWDAVIVTALVVSVLWIRNLWVQFFQERRPKSD